VVVHSDTPLTSSFESSDPMANQLFRNVVWTQRSNFVEIPTDCPQRDERLGWTGDAQIYAGAANFHADTAAFYTKWLDDLTEAQRPNGAFPDYAPYPMQHGSGYAYGTAWMDAGVIVPWHVWQAYGDTEVIRRHWSAMARFMEFRLAQSPDLRGSNKFNPWGDWLAIGSTTPVEYIDTIYFAYSATLMSQMAGAIGKPEDAKRYSDLAGRIRARFREDYVKADGTLKVDTQTAYDLALAHGMVENLGVIAERLDKMVADNGYRMTTGFLGTYPLLPVLSESGHHDLAVRLFQSRQFPSWGYEVENGATTVWERWDSYTKDKGFFAPAMNSYSHYAFGAVSEWMFNRLAGIRAATPGYEKITVAPESPSPDSNPDQRPIDWVNASYRSIRGTISVRWKREAAAFTLDVTIPPNTRATVSLPARNAASVTEGGKTIAVDSFDGGKANVAMESGTYHFRSAF
jgi:alpha-L-rhamnosidase